MSDRRDDDVMSCINIHRVQGVKEKLDVEEKGIQGEGSKERPLDPLAVFILWW